jgi:hypothetical protein
LFTLAEGFVVVRVVRIRMAGGGKRMSAALDDEIVLLGEAKYKSGRGHLTLFREATKRGLKVTEFLKRLIAPDSRLKRIRHQGSKGGCEGLRLLIPFTPPEVWGWCDLLME